MLLRLAWRNLIYDRRRFLASALGVSFAVNLVIVQLGLFSGLAANASQMIDRSAGDVWITARNTGNFQWGQPIPRRSVDVARGTRGVDWAAELIVGWTQLRHPAGGSQQLEVVGFDPEHGVGVPWNLVEGDLADLSIPGRVVLDRSSVAKVGPFQLGDYRETRDRRVRVAAVSDGITSFTTVPFVFGSLDTARALTGYVGPDDTVYVVAGLRPGAPLEPTLERLRARLPHLDVFSAGAFSTRTRRYWMFETGMGIGFLLTSVLAIAVGTVIVSQNIYATTNENMGEYGTLKAMGLPTSRLATVVVGQALLSGVAGALPGCLLGAVVVHVIRGHGLAAVLTPWLAGITVLAALITCALASGTSLRRISKLEPALVFRS